MHFTTTFLSLLPVLSMMVAAIPSPAPEALNAFRVSPHQQNNDKREGAYANAAGHGNYRRKVKRTLHKGKKRACNAGSASSAAASATTTLVAGGNWAETTAAPSSAVVSTTSAAAPATSTSAAGGGQTFTGGQATWFLQNGNAGACGIYHQDR